MNASIEIKNVSKSYRKWPALIDINLTLPHGKIVGLLGPNGCGKTTLLKILAGLSSDYSGEVKILGDKPDVASKAVVSFLPERSSMNENLLVREALDLYDDFFVDFDREKANNMLHYFKIEPSACIKELSKGIREKLHIALAMSRNAQIYLLDEPISGVDPAARTVILEGIIRNFSENSLLLLSTHLIADVEAILDEVIFLDRGRVILHQEADLLRQEQGKSVDQYFREVFACSSY